MCFEIGDMRGFRPGRFVWTSPILSLRADGELGVATRSGPSVWPVSIGLAFADPGLLAGRTYRGGTSGRF